MLAASELHRYFKVREMANGRELWLLNGDVRYEVTGDGFWNYRAAPDGDYFLVKSAVETHPWGRPVRLDEVEPLPDGRGLWSPDAWENTRHLAGTYKGSWREFGDRQAALTGERIAS